MYKKLFVFVVLAQLVFSSQAVALQTASEPNTAFARGVVSTQGWTLDYPDFAQAMASKTWTFELKPTSGSSIGEYDSVEILLTDSLGKRLGTDYEYATRDLQSSFVLELYISISDVASADLSKPLTATITLDRSSMSNQKDAVLTFLLPVSSFPIRPTNAQGYINVLTSFSLKPIPYPKQCTDIEFQYVVNDPYDEVSKVIFSVIDAKGQEIESTSAFFIDPGTLKNSISLCPSDLKSSTAPYIFQTAISFDSNTGKLQQVMNVTFSIQSATAESDAFVASLGSVCQKGTVFKTVKGASCPSGYKKIVFKSPSSVVWNSLVRVPNSQKGQNLIIYGCVVQFDSDTGGSKFRANTSPTQLEYYGLYGTNSFLTGSSKQLLKLSENDAFLARVNVTGPYIYTTFGGRKTVPLFAIRDFVKMGSC